MSIYEIRAGALAIRQQANDELEAVAYAYDGGLLADGDDGTVELADELPVGFHGEDPEEPV